MGFNDSCVLLGVGIGRVNDRGVYSMKRIRKRKVTLEMTEEYVDGSWKQHDVIVENVDVEDRSLGIDKLLLIALSKLGEKNNGR